VSHEAVQDRLEIVDGAQVQPHEVAVLAGDPVALGDLRRLPGDVRIACTCPLIGLTRTMAESV